MKKADFIELLKDSTDRMDKGAIRFDFSCLLDSLHRDGEITDNQAQSWVLTDAELKSIYIKSSK